MQQTTEPQTLEGTPIYKELIKTADFTPKERELIQKIGKYQLNHNLTKVNLVKILEEGYWKATNTTFKGKYLSLNARAFISVLGFTLYGIVHEYKESKNTRMAFNQNQHDYGLVEVWKKLVK